MITIYQYDEQRIFTGNSKQLAPTEGAPLGWTRLEPPTIPSGKYAQFTGRGGWVIITNRPDPLPEPVPETVTVRQARQWMITQGIMPSQVDALITSTEDETERELLRNYWEYSTEFQRNHTQLIQLSVLLNLDSDQLDQAFREATKL